MCTAVSKSPSQMSVFAFRYKTASKNMATNNASLESYGATDSAQDFDLAATIVSPYSYSEMGNWVTNESRLALTQSGGSLRAHERQR